MTYSFRFGGEYKETLTLEKAKRNLARIFKVSETEVTPLFNGVKEFIRSDIDEITANDYRDLFDKVGLIGHVSRTESTRQNSKSGTLNADLSQDFERPIHQIGSGPTTEADPATMSMEAQAESLFSNELDSDHSAEPSRASTPNSTLKRNSRTSRPTINKAERSAAATWIRIGGLAILASLIADSQLKSALIVDQYGLDLGYWPLLLAHIPLVIGCYLLAVEKNLSPIFRIMGLLSFAGLSILLMVPEDGDKNHKIGVKAIASAVLGCGLLIYWVGGAMNNISATEELLTRLANTFENRQEFPSQEYQLQTSTYQSEQTEMEEIIKEVIELLNNGDIRPNQATELANAMMQELGRYIAWRQYQTYLRKVAKKSLPEGLGEEFQSADQVLFNTLLSSITPQSNKRLYEAVMNWTVAPVDDIEYARSHPIRSRIDTLYDSVRVQSLSIIGMQKNQQNSQSESTFSNVSLENEPVLDVSKLDLPRIDNAKLTLSKHHAEYLFTSGDLAGKTLALGIYLERNTVKRNNKVFYRPVVKVLNHEVPATYMSNIVSVFAHYDADTDF
ncbi:hypothetical protein NBRC116583_07230 [Arenicella sp. 4NH20-0111]|uniref:hypothetical protein n=1 Tax=Arenicella sp. 4NH20-0111 TaxID=3127648 RepID=UPI00310AE6A5